MYEIKSNAVVVLRRTRLMRCILNSDDSKLSQALRLLSKTVCKKTDTGIVENEQVTSMIVMAIRDVDLNKMEQKIKRIISCIHDHPPYSPGGEIIVWRLTVLLLREKSKVYKKAFINHPEDVNIRVKKWCLYISLHNIIDKLSQMGFVNEDVLFYKMLIVMNHYIDTIWIKMMESDDIQNLSFQTRNNKKGDCFSSLCDFLKKCQSTNSGKKFNCYLEDLKDTMEERTTLIEKQAGKTIKKLLRKNRLGEAESLKHTLENEYRKEYDFLSTFYNTPINKNKVRQRLEYLENKINTCAKC